MVHLTPGKKELIKKRHKDLRYTAIGPERGMWRACINIHDERGRFASRVLLSEPDYKTKAHAIRGAQYIVSNLFLKRGQRAIG